MENEGKILIISGPSGVGKTTVCEKLEKENDKFVNSISVTSRPPRGDERNGVDYFFRTKEQFEKMIEEGEFLECVEFCGHYYGTTKNFVSRHISEGKILIFNIDVEGFKIIKKRSNAVIISVFLMPPSLDELKRRIEKRAENDKTEIEKRLEKAKKEMEQKDLYDFIVINDNLDDTILEISNLVKNN